MKQLFLLITLLVWTQAGHARFCEDPEYSAPEGCVCDILSGVPVCETLAFQCQSFDGAVLVSLFSLPADVRFSDNPLISHRISVNNLSTGEKIESLGYFVPQHNTGDVFLAEILSLIPRYNDTGYVLSPLGVDVDCFYEF